MALFGTTLSRTTLGVTDSDDKVWAWKVDRNGDATGREYLYHDPAYGPLNPVNKNMIPWRYPDQWTVTDDATGKAEKIDVPTNVIVQMALLDFFLVIVLLGAVVAGIVGLA